MSKVAKTREKVLLGNSEANIDFGDICNLMASLGFSERISGGHHIFVKFGVEEIINLQPKAGKAKPYQVRQVRNIILKYKLGMEDE